ncbi:hypothetical protein RFI_10750 [Reticulomyxa filosa]|uniref:Uncharacterized protein n=1 Tax=Reticulomyxa filosa TaxID=46433 RepID=X6NL20_RETFI|nr:hypothetical protein RFI_10750 [Reticulomyxa filosa]|eukprot:ETO26389.1 hypothetical protein RFI_10750 [Reticulomyxa filosa]
MIMIMIMTMMIIMVMMIMMIMTMIMAMMIMIIIMMAMMIMTIEKQLIKKMLLVEHKYTVAETFSTYQIQVLVAMCNFYIRVGMYKEALEWYLNKFLNAYFPDTHADVLFTNLEQSLRELKAADNQVLKTYMEGILRKIGKCYKKLNEWDKALEYYHKACIWNEWKDIHAIDDYFECTFDLRAFDHCRNSLNKLVNNHPEACHNADYLYFFSRYCQEKGDYDEGLKHSIRAMQLVSSSHSDYATKFNQFLQTQIQDEQEQERAKATKKENENEQNNDKDIPHSKNDDHEDSKYSDSDSDRIIGENHKLSVYCGDNVQRALQHNLIICSKPIIHGSRIEYRMSPDAYHRRVVKMAQKAGFYPLSLFHAKKAIEYNDNLYNHSIYGDILALSTLVDISANIGERTKKNNMNTQLDLHRWDEARKEYEIGQKMDKYDSGIYSDFAHLHLMNGNSLEAQKCWDLSLEKDFYREDTLTLHRYAFFCHWLGNNAEALDIANYILSIAKHQTLTRWLKAIVLMDYTDDSTVEQIDENFCAFIQSPDMEMWLYFCADYLLFLLNVKKDLKEALKFVIHGIHAPAALNSFLKLRLKNLSDTVQQKYEQQSHENKKFKMSYFNKQLYTQPMDNAHLEPQALRHNEQESSMFVFVSTLAFLLTRTDQGKPLLGHACYNYGVLLFSNCAQRIEKDLSFPIDPRDRWSHYQCYAQFVFEQNPNDFNTAITYFKRGLQVREKAHLSHYFLSDIYWNCCKDITASLRHFEQCKYLLNDKNNWMHNQCKSLWDTISPFATKASQ